MQHPTAARLYHGTRAEWRPGDLIAPAASGGGAGSDLAEAHVRLAHAIDEAIWSAELSPGDGVPRVYVVESHGPVEDASTLPDWRPPGHPAMTWRTRSPVRVVHEVTEWLHYHGTRADLAPGDLITPGYNTNYGDRTRSANFVYFARTMDAATWGAELAVGDGPGRIYLVEPTGPIEDDPNVTDQRFRGNPTKSFRSRAPLRITGEVREWRGHAPEAIEAMKRWLEQLAQGGVEAIDD